LNKGVQKFKFKKCIFTRSEIRQNYELNPFFGDLLCIAIAAKTNLKGGPLILKNSQRRSSGAHLGHSGIGCGKNLQAISQDQGCIQGICKIIHFLGLPSA
jgi:hypothetical protein